MVRSRPPDVRGHPREHLSRVTRKHLAEDLIGQSQHCYGLDVAPGPGHAGPVSAEDHLLRDAGKVAILDGGLTKGKVQQADDVERQFAMAWARADVKLDLKWF